MATAYVQGKGAQTTSGSSTVAVTFTSAVTAGNVIALFFAWLSTTATLNTIAQTSGTASVGTFTLLNNPTTGTGQSSQAAQAWAIVNGSGTCTITVTISANAYKNVIVHEISGVNTSTPLDNNLAQINPQATPGTGADAITSGSITTTVNGDYLFVVGQDSNAAGTTFTVGSGGWTNEISQTGSGYNSQSEDMVQATAGAIAGTFTGNQSFSHTLTGIMAFQPSGPAGDVITEVLQQNLVIA